MGTGTHPTEKKFRVAEIFGPTIQGEGRHAGIPCYFVRFGGCDYRCTWCDTPFAVLPEQVSKLNQMTAEEIVDALKQLPGEARWVVISGGNPALFDLSDLMLKLLDYYVMVETQGTVWNDWLNYVDELCISPKPPSSQMTYHPVDLKQFLADKENLSLHDVYLKVVVFDDTDYEWAVEMHRYYPELDFFLSVGNEDPSLPTVGNPHPTENLDFWTTQDVVLGKMKWLFEKVANDPRMANVRVMPQLHTLAWGNQRGR